MKIADAWMLPTLLLISASGLDLVRAAETTPAASATPALPQGAPDYHPATQSSDGQHLALTLKKLENGFSPERHFLIWALGSSYTNMLGNGEFWQEHIPSLFPVAPPIEYKKMVGNSCPWQYLPGWARHLAIPDQPDLVLIYTIGKPEDLEATIVELQSQCTADIIVPSIHWRERDQELFGNSEDAVDQDVSAVREICAKYGVEFVENRKQWGDYLAANQLPVPALLKDAVHQSDYGREIINRNILAHLRQPKSFAYDPDQRETRIAVVPGDAPVYSFTGNRIDLVGKKTPNGGSLKVLIGGQPADTLPVFLMTYIQPAETNYRAKGVVPRDNAPHGITLGKNVVPQQWTITVTTADADYRVEGSVTGPDGTGNATQPFQSNSGQIIIDPRLWRRSERNKPGDTFTFEIYRCTLGEVSFLGKAGEPFRVRLAQNLENTNHELTLLRERDGETPVEFLEAFHPPLKPGEKEK